MKKNNEYKDQKEKKEKEKIQPKIKYVHISYIIFSIFFLVAVGLLTSQLMQKNTTGQAYRFESFNNVNLSFSLIIFLLIIIASAVFVFVLNKKPVYEEMDAPPRPPYLNKKN